jgi:NIMA (never in mitosis gene a)-related kinase
VDAAETTSTSVSDERTRSGEDATGSSSSGVGQPGVDDGLPVRARGEARREKHERHAFPVVRSDPVSHLRAKYRVGKAVGKGGYAVVYKGARVFDGLPVAVKKVDIRGMPDKKRERCLREVQLLGNVTHGNVVRMLDSFLDDRYLVIVFEWADGGDLRRFVRARREAKKPLDEPEIWTVFAQIVDALAHLHRRDVGVAHRDVKPANVLVVNGVVKLADLGLGKRIEESDAPSECRACENGVSCASCSNGRMRSKVGTPYYVAPEIVRGDAYGLASDVWSLGCLLYELATLRSPFEMTGPGADVKHVFRRIGKHEFVPLTNSNGRHSHALVSLTTSMLDADPARRPTMETIRETCQLARASFDAVDRLGPTRGVYAAAERVCDRLALLSARGNGVHDSTVARPKPGTLELALGQPGVFVEASPSETDRTRFARVARLAAWLLPLARFAPAKHSPAPDFANPERVKQLAAALEAYAEGEAEPRREREPAPGNPPADGGEPPSAPRTPAKPPTPPPGPAPSGAARSSPRRLKDAAHASASAEACSGEAPKQHTDFESLVDWLETGGGSAERREETRRARKRAAPPSRASSRRAPFERARASLRGRVSSFRARRAAGGRRAGVRGRVSRRRVSGQTQVRVAAVGGARTRVGRSHRAQRALRRGVRRARKSEPPALSSGSAHNFGVGLVADRGESGSAFAFRRRGNDASSEGEGEASIRGEAPDAPSTGSTATSDIPFRIPGRPRRLRWRRSRTSPAPSLCRRSRTANRPNARTGMSRARHRDARRRARCARPRRRARGSRRETRGRGCLIPKQARRRVAKTSRKSSRGDARVASPSRSHTVITTSNGTYTNIITRGRSSA